MGATEIIIGLLRIIRDKEHGASVTLGQMGLLERADNFVFESDESCRWCGGRTVVSDGTTCPECGGDGLRR